MAIVDTHVHVAANWYEPVEVLLTQMDANGVEQALLVQQMGQFDNSYLIESIQRFPDRLRAIVLVDASQPDACDVLASWAAQGARGVRLRPTDRSPGADPLAIWRQAAKLRLPVSCGGSAEQFADPAFAQVVAAVPDAMIIIEHLGGVSQPASESGIDSLRQQVFNLARYANVSMKFHGLGEICRRAQPFPQPFPFERTNLALLDAAVAAFGTSRMMWGSDYPPVSAREGYANALRWPREHFARLGADEQVALFSGTAARLFP